MFQKGKKLLLLILIVIVFVITLPCSYAFAADTEPAIIEKTFVGTSVSSTKFFNELRFYTNEDALVLNAGHWQSIAQSHEERYDDFVTHPEITDLGSFTPYSRNTEMFEGCTGFYKYSLPEELSNKIMRLPLIWKFGSSNISASHDYGCLGLQNGLDYLIEFKVAFRCARNNSQALTNYPLYMLFYDNESGIENDYYKAYGGYWKNFYVKRVAPYSFTVGKVDPSQNDTNEFALNFKIVISGSDLRLCRHIVLQMPLNQSLINLAVSDCYVSVYNENYEAIKGSSELEKQENQNAADSAVGDSNDAMSDALGGGSGSVEGGFGSLVDVLSTSDTAAAWQLGQVYLPEINGVMERITLLEPQSINFSTYINMIPQDIMTVIRAITTIALIIFCIKELYSTISYVLTLKSSGGTE